MKPVLTVVFALFAVAGFSPISLAQSSESPDRKVFEASTSKTPQDIVIPPPPAISELFLDEGDYYLVRGAKVHLRRDVHRVVIKFKNENFTKLKAVAGQSDEESATLHSMLKVPASEMTLRIDHLSKTAQLAVVHADHRGKLLRSRIREMHHSPAVESVYPLFVSNANLDKMLLTDEIVVRFDSSYDADAVGSLCSTNGLSIVRKTEGNLNVFVLRLDDPKSAFILDVANSLNANPGVLWAEPNFVNELKLHTNDPLFPEQWHLSNTGQGGGTFGADVKAEAAWLQVNGSSNVVIAIIDDGVDLTHEDLAIWRNPDEYGAGRESNGIDDDGNGYIDDHQGWDFFSNDNNPSPGGSHGTACAGIAAAKGNNLIGISGIAYGCLVLPVKIADIDDNFVTPDKIGESIEYAANHADVISCSWRFSPSSYIMDGIDYAVTNGRGGLGSPVFVAGGNSAARGWTEGTILGFPAGQHAHGWQYQKDATNTSGADAAWVDDVTLQNGTIETFNSVSPPSLPPDWFNLISNHGNWSTVTDAFHRRGPTGNSVRSGVIGPNQFSRLYVNKNYAVAGNYRYYVWVDAGAGDGLYALYFNGSNWVAYKVFIGEGISFPANYVNSIAVGACNNLGLQSSYSQYGPEMDFVAPSSGGTRNTTTTDRTGSAGYTNGNYYSDFSGTSSATPLAAGVAALVLSANAGLTAGEIKEVMRTSADKIGSDSYANGWNMYYGYGRVNAAAAVSNSSVNLAVSLTDSPDPVTIGSSLSYNIFVTNLGRARASSVALTNILPAGVTLVSVTPSQGTYTSNSGVVTCDLGSLSSNATATVTIVVQPTSANSLTNFITVNSSALDPSLANNTATSVTAVTPVSAAPTTITSLSARTGVPGSTLTITGTGFSTNSGNNIVWFGSVRGAVTAATSTELTVTVPFGATHAPIKVTVGGLTSESRHWFTPRTTGVGELAFSPSVAQTGVGSFTYYQNQAVGDLNNDGWPDVVTFNTDDSKAKVMRNTLTGPIAANASLPSSVLTTVVALNTPGQVIHGVLEDVDNDGWKDIVTANYQNHSVSIFRNMTVFGGTITFAAPVTLSSGASVVQGVAVADLDADGRAEILTANSGFIGTPNPGSDDKLSIIRNLSSPGILSNSSFGTPVIIPVVGRIVAIATTDLNGDGRLDITCGSSTSGAGLWILQNQTVAPGAFSFAPKFQVAAPQSVYSITPSDFDADGRMDLLLGSYADVNSRVVYNGDNNGVLVAADFAPHIFSGFAVSPYMSVGELNGDEKPDTLGGNASNSDLPVRLNASPVFGVPPLLFAEHTPIPQHNGNYPAGTTIVDMDRDGRNDLVSSSPGGVISLTRNVGLSSLESWRQQHFGSYANTAAGADTNDFDADGLKNLIEWAFALNPTIADAGHLEIVGGELTQRGNPTVILTNGANFGAVFTRRKNHIADGLSYTVRFSGDLLSWHDNTAAPTVIADDDEMEAVCLPFPSFLGGQSGYFQLLISHSE